MSAAPDLSAQEIAQRAADAMWAGDRASLGLGITIVSVGPGTSELTMTVREDMVNGHDIAHGGFIFALADSAFAFACNAYGDATVAAQCSIAYVRPAKLGDVLVATAREILRSGRSGIYDISVATGRKVIAEFRGHSRVIGGSFIAIAKDQGAV